MTTPIHYNFSSRIFIITDDVDVQKQFLPPIEFDDDCIVTKYLTSEQRDSIRSQQVTREEVDHFVYHFNSKNSLQHMVDNLKENEKNGMLALRAWHEKFITDEQFFTACYVYSALDQMYIDRSRYEVIYHPSSGITQHELSLKPEFFTATSPTLSVTAHSLYDEDDKNVCLKKYFRGTEHFIPALLEMFKNLPESEKSFLTIDLPLGPVSNWSPLYGRLEMITNFLHRLDKIPENTKMPFPGIEVPKFLVVPSYSMYKYWFAIFDEHNELKFQPLLGKISKQAIMEHLEIQKRLGNVSIPGALVPKKADNNFGGRYFFCLHDIYHMIRMLYTPKCYFRGMLKVCDILTKLKISQPHNATNIEAIRWKILDGENFGYNEGTTELFGAIFDKRKQWTKELKESVLRHICFNKLSWKIATNLTIKEHLFPKELAIYIRIREEIKKDRQSPDKLVSVVFSF